MSTNRVLRFVKRPEAGPTPDCFAFDEQALAPLADGEYRMQNCLLSMDPAMIARMRPESNYAESVNQGEVMHAYGIGQVVESKNPKVKVGELRMGRVDMQEYCTTDDAEGFRAINRGLAPASWYLSVCGITGLTSHFTLLDILQPKAGETMLISAGGSSVGMIAAQMAKAVGCRTVAIVSTDDKADWVKQEAGYDAAVAYRGKSIDQLTADIAAACPNGVDCYFDNVSGDVSEAVMDLMNDFGRIAVIGRLGISHLADTRDDVGRRDNNNMLAKRLKKQGLVLLDYQPRFMEGIVALARQVHAGKIKHAEDVMEGFDNIPGAFFRMVNGENRGKQLVRLAEIDEAADPSPIAMGRLLRSDSPVGALLRKLAIR